MIDEFRASGFVVLRGVLDARLLGVEVDAALEAGAAARLATGVAHASYVPMMVAATPVSLALLDRFQATAAALLAAPVVPLRAKGVRYFGSTVWHRDSDDARVASIGFAAYLEPLDAHSGALWVVPGSHRGELDTPIDGAGAQPIATRPGDVIVFDEHLVHGSTGGTVRRQWRVDYLAAPRSPDEDAATRALLARVFAPDWDGGYDVDRFPTYGPDWLSSERPAVERLRQLGAYELAAEQERFARSRRART